MHDFAAQLSAFVTGLAAPYGREHSVRWRNGIVDPGRFLLSVHKSALADSNTKAYGKLENFLQELCYPVELADQLWDLWNDTSVVHLGYEEPSTDQFYLKIYFEQTTQTQLDAQCEQLIHVALKWDPQAQESATLSRYILTPCQNQAELSEQLASLCPEQFVSIFERLIKRAMKRCDIRNLMLLVVADDNSPRKSFDLNLYNGEMTIGESLDELLELATLNGCQENERLTSQQNLQLGHLAAGKDRNLNDFVTLYYGVEGH